MAKRFDCSCFQPNEVKGCPVTVCGLWALRFGRDPEPSKNRGFAKPALYTEDLASDVRGRYPLAAHLVRRGNPPCTRTILSKAGLSVTPGSPSMLGNGRIGRELDMGRPAHNPIRPAGVRWSSEMEIRELTAACPFIRAH